MGKTIHALSLKQMPMQAQTSAAHHRPLIVKRSAPSMQMPPQISTWSFQFAMTTIAPGDVKRPDKPKNVPTGVRLLERGVKEENTRRVMGGAYLLPVMRYANSAISAAKMT